MYLVSKLVRYYNRYLIFSIAVQQCISQHYAARIPEADHHGVGGGGLRAHVHGVDTLYPRLGLGGEGQGPLLDRTIWKGRQLEEQRQENDWSKVGHQRGNRQHSKPRPEPPCVRCKRQQRIDKLDGGQLKRQAER